LDSLRDGPFITIRSGFNSLQTPAHVLFTVHDLVFNPALDNFFKTPEQELRANA